MAVHLDPFLKRNPLHGDALYHDQMAWILVQEGRWEYTKGWFQTSPGYIWLMTGVYWLFGHEPQMVRVINALLGILTAWGISLCARRFYGERVAGWTFALTALHPHLVYSSGWLYTENLVIPLIVWSIYLLWEARTLRQFALAGVLLGALCLTRASFLPFLLIACGWVWWQSKSSREGPSPSSPPTLYIRGSFQLRMATLRALSVFAIACLVMAPYLLYLYLRFERFVPIALGGHVFFWANNQEAEGGFTELPPARIPLGGRWVTVAEYANAPNPVDRDRQYFQLSLRWIRENPVAFGRLLWLKTRLSLLPAGLAKPAHRPRSPALGIANFLFWLYLLLAHIGALVQSRQWRGEWSLVYGLWVFLWLVIWAYAGGIRMLLPAIPFVTLFFVRGVQLIAARCLMRGRV